MADTHGNPHFGSSFHQARSVEGAAAIGRSDPRWLEGFSVGGPQRFALGALIEKNGVMTVGETPKQANLWRSSASVIGDRVDPDSIWGLLHREGHRIFPDELFADLYSSRGRRSVPPQVVATVMVLQRLHGKSDREAVECLTESQGVVGFRG